jgi:hypothetical protein
LSKGSGARCQVARTLRQAQGERGNCVSRSTERDGYFAIATD